MIFLGYVMYDYSTILEKRRKRLEKVRQYRAKLTEEQRAEIRLKDRLRKRVYRMKKKLQN